MSQSQTDITIELLDKDIKAIERLMDHLEGMDIKLNFYADYSRQFRIGPRDFAILFNQEVFQKPGDLLHLAERTMILGVVASRFGVEDHYRAHRIVVIRPLDANRVRIQVRRMDGGLTFEGEGAVSKEALEAKIPIKLPYIPTVAEISGVLTNKGEIRITQGTLSIRTKSRAPSQESPATPSALKRQ